jgi:hypothetical protein
MRKDYDSGLREAFAPCAALRSVAGRSVAANWPQAVMFSARMEASGSFELLHFHESVLDQTINEV